MDKNDKKKLEISAYEEIVEQIVGKDGVQRCREISDKISDVCILIKKCPNKRETLTHISTCIYMLLCASLNTKGKKVMLEELRDRIDMLDERTGG